MNRKQIREEAERLEREAALELVNNARDLGADYFTRHPDLLLVEVAREASARYEDVNLQVVFLSGYGRARIDHDAFKRGE